MTAAVLEAALDAIVVADTDGRIVEFNRAAEHMFGIARTDAVGRTLAETIVPPHHRAAHTGGMARVVGGGEQRVIGRRMELEGLRAGGELFPLEIAIVRTTMAGRPMFVAYMRDLTTARAAEAALERSRDALHHAEKLAALGSTLAGVSHELSNPLSAVVGQSIMLEEDAADTPLAERAGKIRLAAERCARIVQTFLAMARQRRPERSRIAVEELVRSALELTDYSLTAAGIVIETAFAPDLPPIEGQADLLQQVIVNLVINAQQALEGRPQPRRLTIRATHADGMLTVDIEDNGFGIAPAIAARIFEPFFTTKPVGCGTGIGLSFSQGVVEAHGGWLRLDPAESEGARFTIALPVATGAASPDATPRPTAAPAIGKGARALVIDDEPHVADTLADMLRRQGYDPIVALGGEAAVGMLEYADFDLIFSDLRMPGLDGPALHGWISQHRPHLIARIAFVTGDALGVSAGEFLEQTGCPFIEKPFTPAAIAALATRLGSARP